MSKPKLQDSRGFDNYVTPRPRRGRTQSLLYAITVVLEEGIACRRYASARRTGGFECTEWALARPDGRLRFEIRCLSISSGQIDGGVLHNPPSQSTSLRRPRDNTADGSTNESLLSELRAPKLPVAGTYTLDLRSRSRTHNCGGSIFRRLQQQTHSKLSIRKDEMNRHEEQRMISMKRTRLKRIRSPPFFIRPWRVPRCMPQYRSACVLE
jgi:hypothetical protein